MSTYKGNRYTENQNLKQRVYKEIPAVVEWVKDSGLSQRLYVEQPFKWPFGHATAPLLPVTLSNCLSPSFQLLVYEHGTHLSCNCI